MFLAATLLSIIVCTALPLRIPSRRKFTLILVSHAIALIKTAMLFNTARNDSWQYFYNTRGLSFDLGTGSVVAVTQILRDIVDDYFVVSMIFSFTAVVSVLLLAERFYKVKQSRWSWETGLFYLVAVSGIVFWGSGIGKDGIVLLGVTIFTCAVIRLPRIKPLYFLFALLLITPIRPHVSLLLLSGLALGLAISRDVSVFRRIALTVVGAAAFAGGLPYVLSYAGIEGGIERASDYLAEFGSRFEGSGSYVDVSSLPAPLRILSFFLRPLPIEARSLTQAIASLQNVGIAIYLWLLIRGLIRYRAMRRGPYPVLLAMSLTVGFVLSFTASNLGLATRQKWMALIPLIMAYYLLCAQVKASNTVENSRTH